MSRWRTVRRWSKRLVLLALLLLVMLSVTLGSLLGTAQGTAWLLRQAADLGAGYGLDVRVGQSSGTLLGRLELHDVRFVGFDTRAEAGRLLLDWRPAALIDGELHLRAIEVDDLRVVPPPPGDAAADPGPLQIPDIVLPVTLRLDRFLLQRLTVGQGDGAVLVERAAFAASLDQRGLAVRELALQGGGVALDGRLGVGLAAPHPLEATLSATVDEALTGEDIGAVSAEATLAGRLLQPSFELRLSAPQTLDLNGSVDLGALPVAFDVKGHWPGLRWPLNSAPEVAATTDGTLALSGTPEDYRLQLATTLTAPDLPPATLALDARGDSKGLTLEPLRLGALDGALQATGRLDWDAGPRWDLALLAEGFNPGLYLPDWSGEIGAQIDVRGGLEPALAVSAEIHRLEGRLRDYPLSGQGRVHYAPEGLRIEGLRLTSGSNRIAVDGQIAERIDLDYVISAPALDSLYPGLAGGLEGSGRLQGTPAAPVVVATLNGESIAFDALSAKAVALDLDWREAGGHGRLRVTGVRSGDLVFDRLDLDLDGTPGSHSLTLAASGPLLQADLAATGAIQDQTWQGRLQQLRLARDDIGEWQLAEPVSLTLGAAQATAGQLCLQQAPTRLCAAGGWRAPDRLDVDGSLANLDLIRFAPLLPGEAVVEGTLGADFTLKGTTAAPDVAFELRPGDGRIRVEGDDEPFELTFRDGRISGRFANDRGSAELRFALGDNGRAQGEVTLGPEAAAGRVLGGRLDVDFPDLRLVAGFVPALQAVQGRLHLDASLAGTLAAPRLVGRLEVADASARVPAAGIELKGVGLRVTGDGQGPLQVEGEAQSGDGRITLGGHVDPAAAGGAVVDLTIAGEHFQVASLPEAQVEVSPDLRLGGRGPYHLSGLLRIPRATIEITELPKGSVTVSDDEIIVGDESAQAPARPPQNLTVDVRVELGDNVTFDGFGLTTALDGVLKAVVNERATTVDGAIELRDGRYEAYGQALTVEQGRLLFAGPPGDPDLDLRAVRVSRDGSVRAYLAMSGPLSSPRPRIYTEPASSEAEALSYLVTGRGLSQASGGDGVNIAAAALSLGISKSEPLLQDLSSRFGLDELRIEGGENGLEDSAVVVGKYLDPNLYVGYSQGLFNPEGAVLLRLKLNERLDVESRSGTEQSVDLFYRYEHD